MAHLESFSTVGHDATFDLTSSTISHSMIRAVPGTSPPTKGFVSFDFVQPLIILRDPNKFTLPIMLALLQNQYGTNLVLVMCAATLATIPILILFMFMSRQFISGLTAGAFKGS